MMTFYEQLDAWVDAHFDEQVHFLQALVHVPTDTPPGNNAPHAERTAELLQAFGFAAERHAVPAAEVAVGGLKSITNLIVRRRYGAGRTIELAVYGRDASDARVLAKLWRFCFYRDSGPTLILDRLQQVEHEAYLTMMAGRTGVLARRSGAKATAAASTYRRAGGSMSSCSAGRR